MDLLFRIPTLSTGLMLISLGAATSCSEWPRYKHKPSIDSNALPPEADPASGIDVTWTESVEDAEPNDAPADGIEFHVGDGLLTEGSLDGLGWDPDAEAERSSECGEALAFPPAAPGDYTGDVDWITIQPSEPGLLCLNLIADHPTARLDASLYVLDDCDEPVGVFVYPETNTPIGTNLAASGAGWAVTVDETVRVAIGIAGFFPDDESLTLDWTASIALVPSVEGAADSLCPEIP